MLRNFCTSGTFAHIAQLALLCTAGRCYGTSAQWAHSAHLPQRAPFALLGYVPGILHIWQF
eukprot:1198529-Lingulodinium_polyedra.AAC.1